MDWMTLATSVVGTSHLAAGTGCQDNCFVEIVEQGNEDLLIAVVADGAGSSKFGAEGSSFVCEAFAKELKEQFATGTRIAELDGEFGRMFIEYCQQQLLPRAEDREESLREFATTFIGCVLGSSEAVFYQLGDGGAVYSSRNNPESYSMALASVPAEYANVTQFVTDPHATDNLRFRRLSLDLVRIALFTDGLQNLAVDYTADDHGIPFGPFFSPMFAPMVNGNTQEFLTERLKEFLSSEVVNNRTDDDKTLVLISRG